MGCSHDLGGQQSNRKKKDSPSFLSRAQPMKRYRLFFDCTLWASFSSLKKCFPCAGTCMWLVMVADFRLQFSAHLEEIHLCRRNNQQSLYFKSTFQWPIWYSEISSEDKPAILWVLGKCVCLRPPAKLQEQWTVGCPLVQGVLKQLCKLEGGESSPQLPLSPGYILPWAEGQWMQVK